MEVAPGVFVGKVSARVRDELWLLIGGEIGNGTALMVISARNEQGFEIRNIGHRWTPIDMDGVIALRRPLANDEAGPKVKTVIPRAARYRWLQSKQK